MEGRREELRREMLKKGGEREWEERGEENERFGGSGRRVEEKEEEGGNKGRGKKDWGKGKKGEEPEQEVAEI